MEYAVETHQLSKSFGSFVAVDRISIQIRPGEVCGLLGANGAGKSTAIRMLCGILQPTSGKGTVLGFDIVTEAEKLKNRIGYMSQKFSLYEDLTVYDNLSFYAGIYNLPKNTRAQRISEMISLAALNHRDRALVGQLSVGWKQRLALCCAIIAHPALVFLDEPTSGVSPISRRKFFNVIQDLSNQGTTVVVTTHFMDEAERCDRIAFMSDGKLLAFDTPDNLKKSVIQGQMAELALPDPLQQIKAIENLPFVQEASVYGSFIHVLLKNSDDMNLLAESTGTTPKPISPTLEDVFIALAKKTNRG